MMNSNNANVNLNNPGTTISNVNSMMANNNGTANFADANANNAGEDKDLYNSLQQEKMKNQILMKYLTQNIMKSGGNIDPSMSN